MRVRPAGLTLVAALIGAVVCAAPAAADLTVVGSGQGMVYTVVVTGASSMDAPQDLTIRSIRAGYYLHWDPPVGVSGQDPVSYTVYRIGSPESGGNVTVFHVGDKNHLRDTGVQSGVYVYFVTAVYASAESLPSDPVSSPDVRTTYPHCTPIALYPGPPYFSAHFTCLFPV